MAVARAPHEENWIETLADLPTEKARRSFLRAKGWLHVPAANARLYDEVVRLARVDLNRAARLAHAARWLADKINDDACRALSFRATGHVLHLSGRHMQALRCYENALRIYQRLHREIDVGRTYSGALHTLIYLGKYAKATSWAGKARTILQRHHDRLRVARLDLNLGNILYRQDRPEEALRLYLRAYREFQRAGEPQDFAIALRNLSVCYITLGQFARALAVYRRARSYCERRNMPLLVAETDYNIAYLHYLRGQYTLAMQMYEVARQRCQETGDDYHKALCDLDESELYLEINLFEDGLRLAQRAFSAFEALGMRYEAAKALTNLALAHMYRGSNEIALGILRRARKLFVQEKNRAWSAMVDLYEGTVLYRSRNYSKSRWLCQAALTFFKQSGLPARSALCRLLLARLDLQLGELKSAQKACLAALRLLRGAETPALDYRAWFVLGQIQEGLGQGERAIRSYKKAHRKLESLRSQLLPHAKIAFLEDKALLYENVVRLCLVHPTLTRREAAFSYIEQAKSRSLSDLIAFRADTLSGSSGQSNKPIRQVRDLRQELTWVYKSVECEETPLSGRPSHAIRRLRRRACDLEHQISKLIPHLWVGDEDFANLQGAKTISLTDIRSALPEDTLLLEYYAAGGMMYVVLIGRDLLEIVPLAPVSQIHQQFLFLQLQLSKFRLGMEYLRMFAELLRSATEAHLRALYTDLISPVRSRLSSRRLVIVPHDFLHCLPFHALFDGSEYLIDQFSVSYAPSASVYYLCCNKKSTNQEQSLVMGVPDVRAPHIYDEVKAVAATLPEAQVFLGPDATVDRLRRYGRTSRFLHIATHARFWAENPMFSSIRLGDVDLSVFDLYDFHLASELLTVSGCGTGLNVVTGGDELLGLVRGFFYAGVQAVLVTLWDVNDQSTTDFMKCFYRKMTHMADKAQAMKEAVQEVRRTYPDVYHWAPFVLIGKFAQPKGLADS
jgi:CHAT domain-containing protein/predicted negative regulator of RcsB-dependent stress response